MLHFRASENFAGSHVKDAGGEEGGAYGDHGEVHHGCSNFYVLFWASACGAMINVPEIATQEDFDRNMAPARIKIRDGAGGSEIKIS
ncbi:hypothetical protein [Xanthobacter sediminis]|uniref:hypothetical protein n=1 Tax=Xanthobacter sediminis TaxID=3119926 RepID=UPI0037277448